jgi:hypothetical protein
MRGFLGLDFLERDLVVPMNLQVQRRINLAKALYQVVSE